MVLETVESQRVAEGRASMLMRMLKRMELNSV